MQNKPLIICALLALSACAQQENSLQKKWRLAEEREPVTVNVPPLPEHDKLNTIKRVQRKYAHLQYASDQDTYGVSDYWATREEMKTTGKYDCEDFVRGVMNDLIELGFSNEDLKMIVAQPYADPETPHALLAAKENGRWIILDCNRQGEILPFSYLLKFKKLGELPPTR